jgi:hypothetical protein
MGSRIHKVLGYGLNDVGKGIFKKKGPKHQINDTRFSENSIINGDHEDRELHYSNIELLQFLDNKIKEATKPMTDIHWLKQSVTEHSKRRTLHDCFVHQSEFGLPNVVVVVPFMELQQWRQYDSMIDYVQECYVGKKTHTRVDIIDESLYPWAGHIDSRTGRYHD